MLISCEKCSTTYVLDDALIPAQGAPVQCTRCGHVFTAKKQTTEPAPPPAWEQPSPSGRVGTSTMVFGAQPAAQQQPQAPVRNTTMMFGAGGAAPPPPPQPPPARNQTMMFGAPGQPSAPAPPPPAPPAPKNTTMMFGAPGQHSAPAPQQPPPPAPKNTTMVFGAPQAPQAPARPPPPASKQTMVFGAVPPSAGDQTVVEAPAAPRNQTVMFGAPQPPAPEPQRAGSTAIFGAVESQPAKNQTMMFGRAPDAPKQPAPKVPRVTPKTVELAGIATDEEAPRESTVRVDLESMIREQGDEPEPVRHDRTQRYAMTEGALTTPPGTDAVQDRHNRTQLFAMSSQQETTKPDSVNVSPFEAARAGTDSHPMLEPVGSATMLDGASTLPPDAPIRETLMFGSRPGAATQPHHEDPPGVSVLLEPGQATPPEALAAEPHPIATTMPNLSPLSGPQLPPLQVSHLPPEPAFASSAATQRLPTTDVEPQLPSSGRGTKIVVIIFLLVALGLGLTLIWVLFGQQLMALAR